MADDTLKASFPTLLTVQEVCERLKCSRSYVDKLRRTGGLRSLKLGSAVRFEPDALEEFLAKQRKKSGEPKNGR